MISTSERYKAKTGVIAAETTVLCLVSLSALLTKGRVKLIETGRREGAELVARGEAVAEGGYFVQPTVFANTTGRTLTLTARKSSAPY